MSASPLEPVDDAAVAEAIRNAEKRTSGEIRVFISRHRIANPAREAHRQFSLLEMSHTPLRNAVLLYFAPASGGFALAADESVTFRAGDAFAETVRAAIEPSWSQGRFQEAILAAVEAAGLELSRHFPRSTLDRDDLPNQVLRD